MNRDDQLYVMVAARIQITNGQAIIDAARREIAALLAEQPDDELLTSALDDVTADPAAAVEWLFSATRAEFLASDGFIVVDGKEWLSRGREPDWWARVSAD